MQIREIKTIVMPTTTIGFVYEITFRVIIMLKLKSSSSSRAFKIVLRIVILKRLRKRFRPTKNKLLLILKISNWLQKI